MASLFNSPHPIDIVQKVNGWSSGCGMWQRCPVPQDKTTEVKLENHSNCYTIKRGLSLMWRCSRWLIMVIKLSEMQLGLKSYAWFQNWTSAEREFDLKSQVWFQTIIARHKVQLPIFRRASPPKKLGAPPKRHLPSMVIIMGEWDGQFHVCKLLSKIRAVAT